MHASSNITVGPHLSYSGKLVWITDNVVQKSEVDGTELEVVELDVADFCNRFVNHKEIRGAYQLTTRQGDTYHLLKGRLHNTKAPAVQLFNGVQRWYKHGLKHRIRGPAVFSDDGSTFWYQNDQLHRTDGPSVELVSGHKEWWVNGILHRTDGPAIEWADGAVHWWQDGRLHRIGGPAVVHASGYCAWYEEGKLNRRVGPAIIRANGTREWWIDGVRLDPLSEAFARFELENAQHCSRHSN